MAGAQQAMDDSRMTQGRHEGGAILPVRGYARGGTVEDDDPRFPSTHWNDIEAESAPDVPAPAPAPAARAPATPLSTDPPPRGLGGQYGNGRPVIDDPSSAAAQVDAKEEEAARARLKARNDEYVKFKPEPKPSKARTKDDDARTSVGTAPEAGEIARRSEAARAAGTPLHEARTKDDDTGAPPSRPASLGPVSAEEIARRRAAAGYSPDSPLPEALHRDQPGAPPREARTKDDLVPRAVIPSDDELVPIAREPVQAPASLGTPPTAQTPGSPTPRPPAPGESIRSGVLPDPRDPSELEPITRDPVQAAASLASPPTAAEIARRNAAADALPPNPLTQLNQAVNNETARRQADAATSDPNALTPSLPLAAEAPTVQPDVPVATGVLPEHPPLPPRRPDSAPAATETAAATGPGTSPEPGTAAEKKLPAFADEKHLPQAIKAGLHVFQKEYTQPDPREGPVPDPLALKRRLVRYASNADAPDDATMKQVFTAVDPQHKLDKEQQMLKGLQDQYDFWIARGRPDKAADAVASMLSYSKKSAATIGSLAQAAFENGDNIAGMQILSRGYAMIPDGKSLRVDPVSKNGKPDKDGVVAHYKILDRISGKVLEEGDAKQGDMMQMAAGMADGSGWLQTMLTAAQQGTGGKQPSAYQQRKTDTAAKGAAFDGLVDKLEAARENPDDEAAQTAAEKASEDYRKMVGTDDMGARQFQRAYKAAGYTDQTMPDWAKPYAQDKTTGKHGTAGERADASNKEIIAATNKAAAAEKDPITKGLIQLDGVSKLYETRKDRTPKASDIANVIPEDIPDDAGIKAYGSVVHEIMRKNNVTAEQAASFIDSLRSNGRLDFTDKGTVQAPGLDVDLFVNANILSSIRKLPRRAAVQRAAGS
jgi:hypothetical protein